MRTYIKRLQSKPEHVRKQILFGSLIVSMAFVSIVWINSLGTKFNKETSAQAEEDIKPFALFGKTIIDTYGNVRASVGNISSPNEKDKVKKEKEKIIELIPVEHQ